MALSACAVLAVLCAQVALSQTDSSNDMSLLQKSWHFDSTQSLQSDRSRRIPEVFVDLDAAPETRWHNVTRFYRDKGVYPEALQKRMEDFTAEERSLLEALHFEDEHLREFRGIVASFEGELVDPEASVEHLKISQLLSELKGNSDPVARLVASMPYLARQWADQTLEDGCSGFLAAMPNGTVVHGRNMDLGGFEMEVKGRVLHFPEVSVEVTFLRSGKPFITSIQWPLSIGFHTAMRYGAWSFQNNIRFHSKDSSYLAGIFRGSQSYKLAVRQIMETVSDFETAIAKLYDLNLMAPTYFIVAGPKPYEGAVITMDRSGEHVPSTPLVTRLSSGAPVLRNSQNHTGSWHIIQTNDDLNKPALDDRRPTAEARLLESTQDMVSPDWVYSQLMRPPLLNDHTVFTSIFIPSSGYHKTVVHFDSYKF
mmetsp:Transcript_75436/g.174895  ORF Transcript_75436/g.174895 Transcript_75436/m.174895 type:complete len:424 (-) Transcript_75436:170-1441(-)|eukprot:CAMPEP_0171105928 /NCGR_PEP_ID=MMETSP0766_2-20121228/63744_1 /TAXON_ID=439317 /ORGANISM="Gambierdiscus australes, Strain CAWD 149" /LENGTH=423 /DNA_ID=CAMNT_0011566905 /DNA_START=96 /DNA_END=1367 /DNA_ORIENTATION=-